MSDEDGDASWSFRLPVGDGVDLFLTLTSFASGAVLMNDSESDDRIAEIIGFSALSLEVMKQLASAVREYMLKKAARRESDIERAQIFEEQRLQEEFQNNADVRAFLRAFNLRRNASERENR